MKWQQRTHYPIRRAGLGCTYLYQPAARAGTTPLVAQVLAVRALGTHATVMIFRPIPRPWGDGGIGLVMDVREVAASDMYAMGNDLYDHAGNLLPYGREMPDEQLNVHNVGP